MKKIFTCIFFAILCISAFGQNVSDYSFVPLANINSVVRGSQTRFAIAGEIITTTVSGQRLHVLQSGTTLISFEMNSEQERQLNNIRADRDYALILFTRRGTNNDNYRFITDRLIPLRNVFGVTVGELPRTFNAYDFNDVLELYMRNPVTDPDGRVTEKVRQAQIETDRAQEAARNENARRLDAANREAYLNSVTVGGGYKPVFRQMIVPFSDIQSLERIVVLGRTSGNQIETSNISQYLYLINSDNIVEELTDRRYDFPREGRSYNMILFLTRSGRDYVLDRYEFYYDLIKDQPREDYPTHRIEILDAWIIENADN